MLWMASPPEAHSTLLSSGPGPGALLAAAGAWSSLSVEYTAAAAELEALLGAVNAGAWLGTSADQYVAAHQPYLAWLARTGADSAVTAARHETAAAAYSGALAAMPSLAELAANHTTHAALVATNFFGINTASIAVNEADYVRMWVQAATTMSTYQEIAFAAAADAPAPVTPPPVLASAQQPSGSKNPLQGLLDALDPILKSLGITDSQVAHDPTVSNPLTTFIAQILQNVGLNWDPAAGTLNGHFYDYYSNAAQPIWYLARSLELFEDFLNMSQNPAQAIQALQYLAAVMLFDWPTHVIQFITTVSQSPALAAAAIGAVAPAGSAGLAGLAGLGGLAAPQQPVAAPAPPAPIVSDGFPAAMAPALTPPGAAPAAAPSAAPPSPAGPPAGPPPPGVVAGAPGFFPPYVVGGPPGIGFDSGMGTGAAAGARRRTPEPDPVATGSALSALSRRRTRRTRRAGSPDRGDRFADMDIDVEPDWSPTTASDHGAGPVGFVGTTPRDDARVTGLTTVTGDSGADGPLLPLLPDSWRPTTRSAR